MASALVFLACFAVYAWTASPAIGWLDSPELIAASASLGVPHSPGHPAAVLVGKLGALVPVGDVAARVNLMSAACGAGAAVAVLHAARLALGRAAPELPRGLRTAIGAVAAGVFAVSGGAHLSAVRAEVYALVALLAIAGVAAALAWDLYGGRTRCLYAAGLLFGLALATHYYIAGLVVAPALAFVAIRRQRPSGRRLAVAVTLGALGLSVLAYLPVRASRHPEVNWGAPDTASRLAWTVSARAFSGALAAGTAGAGAGDGAGDGADAALGVTRSRAEDAAQVLAAMVDGATPALAALAVLGLYLGLRRRGWRGHAGLLAAIAVLGAAGRAAVGFQAGVPDHLGYLLPAVAAVIVLAACGAGAVCSLAGPVVAGARIRLSRRAGGRAGEPGGVRGADSSSAAAVVAVALLVVMVAPMRDPLDRLALGSQRGADASDAFARWELDDLPPRALLLPAYFETSFRLWALRAVEGARPDVDILDRSFLTYPGAAAEARRRYPELAALIDAPLRAGAPTPVEALREMARERPVRVQLHVNLDDAVAPHLAPAGAFAAWLTGAEPGGRAALEERDGRARREIAERARTGDGEVARGDRAGLRAALLWHDFLRLRQYCRTGRLRAARRALDDAREAAPDDATLAQLAARCGLSPADATPSEREQPVDIP